MAKLTKRAKLIREAIGDAHVERPVNEALDLLRKLASTKFNESIDVSVNLGIDARKSDQSVRGATVLPNGTGRVVRVAVFADGADAEAARTAGADVVGLDDLAARVKGGQIDFDVAIATPQTMRVVGQLGQILGPRGLMPNPKVGTVAADVAAAVRNAKAGQVQFRADKAGIVHCSIGKVTFAIQALTDNLEAVLADLIKARPSSAKGVYLKSVTLSSTMGPGIRVDKASLRHT